jgi:8-oxo-dGTP pyrophosphatase MutT (NUDIX family)
MSSRSAAEDAASERSAGGVVVHDGQVLAIVPVKRAADGSRVLGLPKGHFDPGETAREAAEREVREETGVEVEYVGELGEIHYSYRRAGHMIPKSVVFFLFSYRRGDIADHDNEVEEVQWLDLAEAERSLTHAAEREILGRALACLEEARKDR